MEPQTEQTQIVNFWIDRTELVNLQTYYNQIEVLEVIRREDDKALVKARIKNLPGFLEEITF